MQTLFIITLVVFHLYLTFIYLKYGRVFSISDSYYALTEKINFLFTLYTWSYALPMAIISLDINDSPLMFFAGAAICFVGVASNYKSNIMTKNMHMRCAAIGVILGLLSLIFEFKFWWLSLIAVVLAGTVTLLGKKTKWFAATYIYWAEIIIIESIFLAIGLKLFN